MGDEKPVSSYHKVFQLLMATSDFSDVQLRAQQRIKNTAVVGYGFEYKEEGYNTGIFEVETFFKVQVLEASNPEDPNSGIRAVGYNKDHNGKRQFVFNCSMGEFAPDEELQGVVHRNFGVKKKCPTYFCKKETLCEGTRKQKSFVEFAGNSISQEMESLTKEAVIRVKDQMKAIIHTDQYKADKKRFFELQVIKEIKEVVLRYQSKVSPEVLKEALDEVVCHAIMMS
jgi:hypothetical protein